MAKIQIKSEKLTPFGGFFRVMEQFDSNKIEGINLIRTNYEEPLPGIRVTPDATEANRLGVNKTILSADLAIHFGDGIPMATLWEGDYPVKMVLKSENDSDLANEYIPVMGGTSSVPLRQLAKISPDWHKRVCNQTCLHPNMFDCKHIMPEMCCRKTE